jgi:hypothetical protein
MTMTNYVDAVLQRAYLQAVMRSIGDEEKEIRRNREFYEGEQGVQLTERQKEYLGDFANDIDSQALCNICRRAVEIPLERLAVTDITPGTDGVTDFAELTKLWWQLNQLGSWQYDLYEASLRDWASCLIVGWAGTYPTFTMNTVYDGEDGQIRLHYSDDDGTLMFASKRWKAWDPVTLKFTGRTRLTIYAPDRIMRYEDSTQSPDGWRLLTPEETGAPNPQPWVDIDGAPLGIPVIVFENPGGSELDDVLMPQKAMNKSLTSLLSTQDVHGFPLLGLVGYSNALPDSDGKQPKLRVAPGEAIKVPAGGNILRVPGVDLAPMFETGVMGWMQLVTIIKGWPLYLWARGEPPSGESLKVMESSLVSQVKRKHHSFGDAWAQGFEMGRKLHQLYQGQLVEGEASTVWADPETHQDLTRWQALQTKWDAALVPTPQRWREAGYTEEQIQQMNAEAQAEQDQATQRAVANALMSQRTQGADVVATNG